MLVCAAEDELMHAENRKKRMKKAVSGGLRDEPSISTSPVVLCDDECEEHGSACNL